MMVWLQAVPVYLAAAAIIFLPGLPLALALRLRGVTLLAGSLAASFAFITASSLAGSLLGLGWSALLPVGFGILTFAVAAPFLRRLSFRPSRALLPSLGWPLLAVGLSAVLLGSLIRSGLGVPDALSQSYDNVFHLNLVQFILDGGDASPLHMTLANPEATTSFYPNTWHATAALVVQLTGSSVELATGAMIILVSCVVWPVAILFFAAQIVGDRPRHLFTIAVIASGFSAFPYLLLRWGVLYPNLLSTALIPIALGFLHAALRRRRFGSEISGVAAWLALAGSLGAGVAAHPNAMFGFAALGLPLAVAALPTFVRAATGLAQKLFRVALVAVPFAVIAFFWVRLSTADNGRVFEQDIPLAFVSALTNAPLLDTKAWFVTILVLGGVAVAAVTRGDRWLIASYAIAVALYTVSSGMEGPVRTMITGLWYNDAHRLAALLVIPAVVLAALALGRMTDLIAAGTNAPEIHAFAPKQRKWIASALISVLLLSTAFGLRGMSLTMVVNQIRDLHALNEDSWLISTNEIELMEEAEKILPEDALIAGNPWNGSALAYTFAQRDVVFPHLGGTYSPEALVLAKELKEGTPEACAAANDLGVTHVLDMGKLYSVRGSAQRQLDYPGLTDVAGSPVLTPLLTEGDATLYELTGCALP